MDTYFLHLINGLPHPVWLEKLVLALAIAGRLKAMAVFVFLLAALGAVKKNPRILWGAMLLGLALFGSSSLVFILKNWIQRPRPFFSETGLHLLGHAKSWAFPSGHATLYATLGAFMIFYFKKAKALWTGLILAGGLARIYQGVHYPTDVLAGWVLGFFTAWLILRLHKSFFSSFFKIDAL